MSSGGTNNTGSNNSMGSVQKEIVQLKHMLMQYQDAVHQISNKQQQLQPQEKHQLPPKQLLELRNLRTEIDALKIQNKMVTTEKEQLEKECAKLKVKLSRQSSFSQHPPISGNYGKQVEVAENANSPAVEQVPNSPEATHNDERYKMLIKELKNMKIEANALRQQLQEKDDIIANQKEELETLHLKLYEKDKQVASFAIWRKSYVYEGNKFTVAQKRLKNVILSQTLSLSSREQRTPSSVVIRIKIPADFLDSVHDLWNSLNEKPEKSYQQQTTPVNTHDNEQKATDDQQQQQQLVNSSSPVTSPSQPRHILKPFKCYLCLQSYPEKEKPSHGFNHFTDTDLINMEIPLLDGNATDPKSGDYIFELPNLNHGSEYRFSSFIKDSNYEITGKKLGFSFISDLKPTIPKVQISFDTKENSIKVLVEKNWKTVFKYVIYHCPRGLSPTVESTDQKKEEETKERWEILDTIEQTSKHQITTKFYKMDFDGTHVFKVSQFNQIGESDSTEPVAIDLIKPSDVNLESSSFDRQGNLLLTWSIPQPLKTKQIFIDNGRNEKLRFDAAPVIRQTIPGSYVGKSELILFVSAESPGGQMSNPKQIQLDPNLIPPFPKQPLYTVKTVSSLLVYPDIEMSKIAKLTTIQARFRINQRKEPRVTEPQNTTAGILITDIPRTDIIQVGIRYAIGNNWSTWSDWVVVIMVAALELPASTVNLAKKYQSATSSSAAAASKRNANNSNSNSNNNSSGFYNSGNQDQRAKSKRSNNGKSNAAVSAAGKKQQPPQPPLSVKKITKTDSARRFIPTAK